MNHPPCCDKDLWSLTPLDVEKATEGARDWVTGKLGDPRTVEEVATKASQVLSDLAPQLAATREARDAAAWTICQHFHVRRGANLPAAIGVNRVRWKKIRDRLDVNPPAATDPQAALKTLPGLAHKAAVLFARTEAATEVRNAAVASLIEDGMTNAAIARLIDRNPSRVSNLRYRDPAA